MKQASKEHSQAALLILIGFPVGTILTTFTNRILLDPYPFSAWGSWLLAGWAAAILFTLIQFVIGTIVHADDLSESFLGFGLPTLLYGFVLLSLTNLMFPESPSEIRQGLLLTEFQQNYRKIYIHAFVLSLLPFVMGFTVFKDPLRSFPQIARIIWMATFALGFCLTASVLAAHKALWIVAFPLMVILLHRYSKRSRETRKDGTDPGAHRT